MSKKTIKAETLDSMEAASTASSKAEGIQINKVGDSPLNDKEQKLFSECETDIQENLRGVFVLGWRLEQIRDNKLYIGSHKTFDAYCRKRWDFSKTHANRHIQAYLCEKHLKELNDPKVYIPTKEAQVRFIADLQPEQQVEVATRVKESVGDGEATGGDFGSAREELFPKTKPGTKAAKAPVATVEAMPAAVTPKFDTKLVSFSDLKAMADNAYNFCGTKNKEAPNFIGKLQRHLAEWATWQAKQEVA